MIDIPLGSVVFRMWRADYVETLFRDGSTVPAAPQSDGPYRERAELLGYGKDTAAMMREHELLHTVLAQAAGLPHSPTLWAVAHPNDPSNPPLHELHEEEARVLHAQSVLNIVRAVAVAAEV